VFFLYRCTKLFTTNEDVVLFNARSISSRFGLNFIIKGSSIVRKDCSMKSIFVVLSLDSYSVVVVDEDDDDAFSRSVSDCFV